MVRWHGNSQSKRCTPGYFALDSFVPCGNELEDCWESLQELDTAYKPCSQCAVATLNMMDSMHMHSGICRSKASFSAIEIHTFMLCGLELQYRHCAPLVCLTCVSVEGELLAQQVSCAFCKPKFTIALYQLAQHPV